MELGLENSAIIDRLHNFPIRNASSSQKLTHMILHHGHATIKSWKEAILFISLRVRMLSMYVVVQEKFYA